MLVGFAAETEELLANAEKKLREKNLDMIVANNVSEAGPASTSIPMLLRFSIVTAPSVPAAHEQR
jgi:phosphopantothenoylcysteine decarboxylase/phosphopantothenate--cysteine ligase